MPQASTTREYITAGEFERFERGLDARLTRLEDRSERVEDKIDALGARGGIDGKVVARKTAVHVSWLTPVVVAIIEGLKMAFGK